MLERMSTTNAPGSIPLTRKLHILSRRLLQSSSSYRIADEHRRRLTAADFLDISVFYEPAMPVLPSIGQARPIRES
jgi:hypothetical protein